MRRLMPASAATSSIDVAEKPFSAKADAAARRMDSRRSASRGTSHTVQVYTRLYTLRPMTTSTTPTTQLQWTEEELLATHPVEEPLVAGGVKCHGGFDEN